MDLNKESCNESAEQKKTITHEERMELCAKLDSELDEYISSLEKKSYTEGWPEDRWQEEMEKHPFFMTKVPEDGSLPPLLEGIQQLKYDPAENTSEELATNYKEDGNFSFKHSKYRMAILSYTEGLKAKSTNNTLNAELHNNRAAAHFFLKNYRSSLMDCKIAIKLQPNYLKPIIRAAKCCLQMKKEDDCIAFCDQGLDISGNNEQELDELRKKAIYQKKIKDRDERKATVAKRLEEQFLGNMKKTIKGRGITVKGWSDGDLDIAALEPCFPAAAHCPVALGEDGRLTWPVLFLYPHYGITDLVQHFHEDTTFREQLAELFPVGSKAEWDTDNVFVNVDDMNIYFESKQKDELVPVSKDSTLLKVLTDGRYVVHSGTPSFLVVIAGSSAENRIKSL
ncbi:DNA polymerase interacting tetratricopeptide repeat-containing, protein of 47 kDa [Neocloeon triangulifer]|uniref:DNA polymerase interacting tetratricopeptide repeat-containing, protein of 47 kDa n=1 Tax=Neocloeon triangulifer TaxID=2078957 RepID=UPI00286F8E18|nr:DNA polymerase interacting tetratricopeptide repeat-containing, protein of 47 kDa [Neocloeon triangulifer]